MQFDLVPSADGNKCHTFISNIYKMVCVKIIDTRRIYDYVFKIGV